jgi:hypothetical protein
MPANVETVVHIEMSVGFSKRALDDTNEATSIDRQRPSQREEKLGNDHFTDYYASFYV